MLCAIFAIDCNGGFAKDGQIPWKSNGDMRHFRESTQGHTIVMGRGTWESLPHKPLPNRNNIVISTSVADPKADMWTSTFDTNPTKRTFVIGGVKLLEYLFETLLFDEIYMTVFDADYGCDIKIDTSKFIEKYEWNVYKTIDGGIIRRGVPTTQLYRIF